MEHVSIYLEDNFKGVGTQTKAAVFLIEMMVKGTPVTLDDTVILTMTPNQAMLAVLIIALSRLNKPCSLDIYLDSVYMAAGFEKWLDTWKANEWRKSDRKPIENIVEWQVLTQMLSRHEYRFHFGEDHSYKKWLVDKLENVDFTPCDSHF